MPIKVIGFDADDTLWPTQLYYDAGHDIVIGQIGEEGYNHYVQKLLGDSSYFGLGTTPVCKAYLETLMELRDGQLSAGDMESYKELKTTLTTRPIENYDNVTETLQALQQDYHLMIITKGQLQEQIISITKSGLRPFVHDFQIMNTKDAAEYKDQVFDKYKINPSEFVMVGNTLKTDIHPVLECGGNGIYIPRHHWNGENTQDDHSSHANLYHADNISEVPDIIKTIEQKMICRPSLNNNGMQPK